MAAEEVVRKFVVDDLLGGAKSDITNDTSLFGDQLLDSMNMIDLISFVEETFSIKLASSQVTLDNLDTISRICNFVERAGK